MILITKNCEWSNHAGRLAKIVFGDDLIWIRGNVGDPMPEIPDGDIISFLCPWVLPTGILERMPPLKLYPGAINYNRYIAINFHPGNEWYPGIGCYNFALHERAAYFGTTCHYMEPQVDTGDIIKRVRFPIFPSDTVETLKFRTMVAMLEMYHKIIVRIAIGKRLPLSKVTWQRKPFTRKQLNQLYKDFPNTRSTIYPDKI